MGFFDKIIQFKKAISSNNLYGFNVSTGGLADTGEKLPTAPQWFFTARIGQPRQINFTEIRQYARSPWIQMVESTFKKEIGIIDRKIVPVDEDDVEEKNMAEIERQTAIVEEFFNDCNTEHENIIDLLNYVTTDVAEIDAGTIVKVFSVDSFIEEEVPVTNEWGGSSTETQTQRVLKPFGQRTLNQLRIADGASILKQIDVFRRLLAYWQYSFKNPRTNPLRFEPDEVVYFMMNPRSYSIYGFSPVQSVQQVVEVLMNSTRWNKDYFQNNLIPDGIINLPGANEDSMKQFKSQWKDRVQGKSHQLVFQNTESTFTTFNPTNKDMEWLEGQKWYNHLIFAVFGVSPVEAGFHENVNQGNQQGQERITVKNAIKPYLELYENKINKNIIPEILQVEKPLVKFKFFPKDHAEEQLEFEQSMKEIENGALTINEYRKKKGLDPVEWGDTPSTVPDDQYSTDPNDDDNNVNDETDPNDDKDGKDAGSEKPEKMVKELEPGSDIVDEADNYADFYKGVVDKWEKKIIAALDSIDVEKKYDPNMAKNFTEFMSKVFNEINTLPFVGKIRAYIKQGLNAGLDSAEQELNIDVGWSGNFNNKVTALENQQLNGYTINGSHWFGIKGATKDVQMKILSSVEDDVRNKRSKKEMTKNIQEIFEGSTKAQAERIARTETNRFINEGKLTAYQDSGVKGRKAYAAVMDSKTSDICRRLHNKYFNKGIPFDEQFVDDVTGKKFSYPPTHPNCRCVQELRL